MTSLTSAIFEVQTVDMPDILSRKFDLCIFASGYEERCIHCPSLLSPDVVKRAVVFSFNEKVEHNQRRRNDEFFDEQWPGDRVHLSTDDDMPIYEYMNEVNSGFEGEVRILMDYSSMSRLWYAALLNWVRTYSGPAHLKVYFVYACGTYRKSIAPLVIKDILAIPGCEGNPRPTHETAAVFGLGYEGESTLAVFDKLEAKYNYAVIANPGASPDAPKIARDKNSDLLEERPTVLEYSLLDLESTYIKLGELISVHRMKDNIVLVPMGPKPHILACILLAMRFQEITLLRVSGHRFENGEQSEPVKATGALVVTEVCPRSYVAQMDD